MAQFLISHIDAIIVSAIGLFFIVWSIRKREALAASEHPMARQLPKLAPVVLLFGIILFFLPTGEEPEDPQREEEPSTWVEVELGGGLARAEFPEAPVADEVLTPAGDFTVKRQTHVLNLAEGKINLRFSFSEHLPGTEDFTDDQRLADIRGVFLRGGFEIEYDSVDEQGLYIMALVHKQKNARVAMKLAFTPHGTYRVISTSMGGYFRDDRTVRFLDSFVMTEGGK